MSNSADSQASAARASTSANVSAEQRFVSYVILVTIILAALPALIGFLMSRPDAQFVGATYNIDDNLVYDSWARQAADGHFFIRNLFTTDPQNPIQFNVLMLLVGVIARITTVPIPLVFFVVRIAAGVGVLMLIYRLYRLLAPLPSQANVRCYALGLACLGNGLGWMFWPQWADKNVGKLPVDTWQPEALTFQSLEMSALFAVALVLIVATVYLLALAQRSGRIRYAVGAGICGLLLGNIHSYDILSVAGAWFVYLVVNWILDRRFDRLSWLQALVCGLITLPSPAYQLYMYHVDPAWNRRVADLTLSLPLQYYALGYGVAFLLGLFAACYWLATRFGTVAEFVADRRAALLPICWFLTALALSYTPHVDFQRKMIMGAHVPLCLLAGCGLAMIAANRTRTLRALSIVVVVLLSLPTTLLWITRDLTHLRMDSSETSTSPFLTSDEAGALAWIRNNTAPDSAFLGFPQLMIFVPGWCDRYTFVSQWGESFDYGKKVGSLVRFVQAGATLDQRAAYLAHTKCDYFVYPNAMDGYVEQAPDGRAMQYEDFNRFPQLLAPVYSNKELTIYKILVLHAPK